MKKATKNSTRTPSQPKSEEECHESARQDDKKVLPETIGTDTAAYNAYISMYSMTLTLLQLVELYDNQSGNEQRMKVLDDLARQFNKFTSLHQK